MKNRSILTTLTCLVITASALAQVPPIGPPADIPAISLNASATMHIDNDRMTIVMQAESEKPVAATAASEVNAKMAKALAVAKSVPGVTAKTVNYTTNQVIEKGKMVRWRVSQWLQIETGDFTAGANLATKLQDEGLLLSSLTFSVSPEARRVAVAKLQHDALTDWQSLAKQAAASMGYGGYTPGRLAINVNDNMPPPRPRFAAQAMAAAAAPEVTVSGGSSEIVLTVSGEAILTNRR
jgi:predicted secreted protein